MLSVQYYSVDVRIYPSLKKNSYNLSVNKAHTRISNFLFSIKKGLYTYFWITKEQLFSLNFYLISLGWEDNAESAKI